MKPSCPRTPAAGRAGSRRERGVVLVVSFLLVFALTALTTAHFMSVQRSSRQSSFYTGLGDLRRYAESGVTLAIHEMTYVVGGTDGDLGTEGWTAADDSGRDGKAGTYDEGEGDGIPTPGEPNLVPEAVGPSLLGSRLLVQTTDTAWPSVKRIVSTAFNGTAIATVEVYLKQAPNTVPGVGAIFAEPGVVLDLKGKSFEINGNDTDLKGKPGTSPTVYGIATSIGDPPASNAQALIDQIESGTEGQITGIGGIPSIGETSTMDFDEMFNAFKAARQNVVAPGTYSMGTWGDEKTDDYQVTYCKGDLHLSGKTSGAGVLVVEGNLTISGNFTWTGVVIIRGDARLTGGGNVIQVLGGLFAANTVSADVTTIGLTGKASIAYSSEALARVSSLLGFNYTVLYWNDIK